MKLLFCVPEQYNGDRWGGVTTYTLTTAEELSKIGHHVTVLTPGVKRKRYRLRGFTVFCETLSENNTLFYKILSRLLPDVAYRIRWMNTVVHFWKKHGPYTIVEYPEWGSSGLLLRLSTNQTCVCKLHRSSLQYRFDNNLPVRVSDILINFFEMASIIFAHASSSPTHFMYKSHPWIYRLIRIFHKLHFIHPYGVQIPRIQKHLRNTKKPYLLYVGRIEPGKGCEYLVRAFIQIQNTWKSYALVLIGEDTQTSTQIPFRSYIRYLQNIIHQSQISDTNIRFMRRQTQIKLRQFYIGATAVIVPSLGNENMPFSALDAIRYAKPLIVSDTGGLPEFVNKNNGLVVQTANIHDLATALDTMLTSEVTRKQLINNVSVMRKRYDIHRICTDLVNMYQSIMLR